MRIRANHAPLTRDAIYQRPLSRLSVPRDYFRNCPEAAPSARQNLTLSRSST